MVVTMSPVAAGYCSSLSWFGSLIASRNEVLHWPRSVHGATTSYAKGGTSSHLGMPTAVACCLVGTISNHSILDQNFRGKNPRERESTAGSGLVLGLMQSITVPYLGSYKLVGEVGEF